MTGPAKDGEPQVMILDEEPFVRDTLQIKLNAQGVTVHTAGTEEEARRMILARTPEAIVIDILHRRIPAYSFVQWLKGQPELKDIPVLILTFKEKDPEIEFLYNVWTADYFTKPFSPREVVKRLLEILRHTPGN